LAAWPTPTTRDWRSDRGKQTDEELYGKKGKPMPRVAYMAGWPTPMAGTPAQKGYNEAGNNDSSRKTVALAGWATPAAHEPGGTPEQHVARKKACQDRGVQVGAAVTHLSLQTQMVGPARLTASGEMLTGSAARMESGGQLHPEHSLWLQLGPFATAWALCAVRVTRSTSRKRKASSKP
jgi:hypothetical protein